MTSPFLGVKNNTTPLGCQALFLDKRSPLKVPWHTLNPLIQEALKLGFTIAAPSGAKPEAEMHKKRKLPMGHRFYQDCYREQSARLIDWTLSKFPGDAWFMTCTFKDYRVVSRAERWIARYLSRLNQAYKKQNSAGLLKSIYSVEWQQRNVIHFHLLILGKGLSDLSRKRWERRWQMIGGGFAACYEAVNKAAEYLVKHQIKENPGSALHLGGAWRDIEPPKSLSRCCGIALNGSSGEANRPL